MAQKPAKKTAQVAEPAPAPADLLPTIDPVGGPTDALVAALLAELHQGDNARRSTHIASERAHDLTMRAIAQALHEDVEETLLSARALVQTSRREMTGAERARNLASVDDQLGRATNHLKRLILEVRPLMLERQGLTAALRALLAVVRTESGITFMVSDELVNQPTEDTRIALFRIVREAVDNIRKYAEATRVTIEVRNYASGFLIRVIDNGRGFDQAAIAEQDQVGFRAMRTSAEARDGWWQVHSQVGEGTTIEVWIPESTGYDKESETEPESTIVDLD